MADENKLTALYEEFRKVGDALRRR